MRPPAGSHGHGTGDSPWNLLTAARSAGSARTQRTPGPFLSWDSPAARGQRGRAHATLDTVIRRRDLATSSRRTLLRCSFRVRTYTRRKRLDYAKNSVHIYFRLRHGSRTHRRKGSLLCAFSFSIGSLLLFHCSSAFSPRSFSPNVQARIHRSSSPPGAPSPGGWQGSPWSPPPSAATPPTW